MFVKTTYLVAAAILAIAPFLVFGGVDAMSQGRSCSANSVGEGDWYIPAPDEFIPVDELAELTKAAKPLDTVWREGCIPARLKVLVGINGRSNETHIYIPLVINPKIYERVERMT